MERWQHKITSKKFDVNFATKELDLVTAEDAKLKHLGNQGKIFDKDAAIRMLVYLCISAFIDVADLGSFVHNLVL